MSPEACRLMARYNRWQNASLITAADGLTDSDRWSDRGAFFKSIAATFNHLYWADAMILARLNSNERPQDSIPHSLTTPAYWQDFKSLRHQRDDEIETLAAALTDSDLTGDISWFPPDGSARVTMSKSLCALQLFNHQTHHRGQIHAMLTALGADPGPTDITVLPETN